MKSVFRPFVFCQPGAVSRPTEASQLSWGEVSPGRAHAAAKADSGHTRSLAGYNVSCKLTTARSAPDPGYVQDSTAAVGDCRSASCLICRVAEALGRVHAPWSGD